MKLKYRLSQFAFYIFSLTTICCALYCWYYNFSIKLESFEALITTGFGLNAAFSSIKQIREIITKEVALKIAAIRCNILDACQSVFSQDIAKIEKENEIKNKLQNLADDYENKINLTHKLTIYTCIFLSFAYLTGLIISAFFPASVIPPLLGILIAIFVPTPIIFSFLYFSYLSQNFEKEGQEMLNILNAFGALIKPVIKPVEPTQ